MAPCLPGPNSLLATIDRCGSATEEVDDFDGGANAVRKAEEQAVYKAWLDWMMQDIGSSNVDSNSFYDSFIEQQMPRASRDFLHHDVVFEEGGTTGGHILKAEDTGELFIN